jgi:hypothetical protein
LIVLLLFLRLKKSVMNPNLNRNLLSRLLSAFLLLLIIFASSGFSYSVHYCHNKKAGIAFYPEITGAKAVCGCEKESATVSKVPTSQNHASVHKYNCCKNLVFFQKLNTISSLQLNKELLPVPGSLFPDEILTVIPLSANQAEETLRIFNIPNLPSGKKLVFMIHQLRIPFPFGDC